jgi:ABC-type glycerol-3-phosphate transport system permease component
MRAFLKRFAMPEGKNLIRIILIGWFIVLNLFIFIPAYRLFGDVFSKGDEAVQSPPSPPEPIQALSLAEIDTTLELEVLKQQILAQTEQVNAYTQRVSAYTQEVAAYTQQTEAYKTYLSSTVQSERLTVYEKVVNGTLLGMLNAFVAALITYVFANVGASLVNNFISKKAQPVQFF